MHPPRWLLLVALTNVAAVCWLGGCSGGDAKVPAASISVANSSESLPEARRAESSPPATARQAAPPPPVDPVVVVHTSAGDLKLRLFAERSPQTVENFLAGYVKRGFYNDTIFHHVEPGSMLIGGGYTADLSPKPTRAPIYNESRNRLSNRRGTVAMIRDPDAPHSATSQFFINLADNQSLDFTTTGDEDVFGYCVFGEVIEGMDVVDRIAQAPTTAQGDFASVPSPSTVIQSIERLR